jgi:tetratricopeptide (TPR) repeat protein
MLAIALRLRGDAGAAEPVLEALAESHPDTATVHFELGLVALKLGKGRTAIAALSRSTAIDPGLAPAWNALEGQLLLAGDGKAAARARAGAIKGRIRRAELTGAATALAEDRLEIAEQLLKLHLIDYPADPLAIFMLGEVLARQQRFDASARLLAKCVALAPDFDDPRVAYAAVLMEQQKPIEALAQLDVLLQRRPDQVAYRVIKLDVLTQLAAYEEAIDLGEGLLAEFPDHPRAWSRYAHLLRTVGRSDESVAAYHRAIELDPGLGSAYSGLANLKTYRFSDAEMDAMRAEIARGALDRASHLHYALGKALEDRGDPVAAFDCYAAANAIRKHEAGYDANEFEAAAQRVKARFTRSFFAVRRGAGSDAIDPIFIVGLPRSGSTLIEQILSSHSHVEGTRELRHLSTVANAVTAGSPSGALEGFPGGVEDLDRQALLSLGEDYLNLARVHRTTDRPRFVDKMPGNFTLIGLIELILPNAKIIDARRHPLGCGWACLRQGFSNGNGFAFDQVDFGRYYRSYVDLMAHHDAVLPGRVHRVIYERMVGDFEAEVRRLLDYCGLPFEDACLRFYETDRPVRTPSAEQVRQPIYTAATDQWRKVEHLLGPMKQALGDVLTAYGG